MKYVILLLALLLATPAAAQPGGHYGPGNAPCCNTSNAVGLQVLSTPVLNTLSNQADPIESPEITNPPNSSATYQPGPYVIGYASSASGGTYESQLTTNLTISGTITNHWGQVENTINLLGTGTMNGELNQEKAYVVVPSGLTAAVGEIKELTLSNSGTVSAFSMLFANPVNNSGGAMGSITGINLRATNNGTSFTAWTALDCKAVNGSSGAFSNGNNVCLYNEDNASEITNAGHYGARPGTNTPSTSNGTLDARANDVMGTVTEGTSSTGAVITFGVAYPFGGSNGAPHCVLSSPNGATWTSYSVSTTAITIVNSAATGNQYEYMCMGTY